MSETMSPPEVAQAAVQTPSRPSGRPPARTNGQPTARTTPQTVKGKKSRTDDRTACTLLLPTYLHKWLSHLALHNDESMDRSQLAAEFIRQGLQRHTTLEGEMARSLAAFRDRAKADAIKHRAAQGAGTSQEAADGAGEVVS